MRSLRAKILLALVISVVIALVVVLLITKGSLRHGLAEYIERQEVLQMQELAPELAALYQQESGWGFLSGHPWRWNRLLRLTRPPSPTAGEFIEQQRRPGPPGTSPRALHERLNLSKRLFLLDAKKLRVAGRVVSPGVQYNMEAVEVAGVVVGWLGFVPAQIGLPREAQRFLRNQGRMLLISLVIALVIAAALGFLLARHLSRPVRALAVEVGALTRGEYELRADIRTKDEIGALGRDINSLAEALEKNRTARRRWMADIAHELRTPIAILKGELEAIEDGVRPLDEKSMRSLREEAKHLARLVDDLQTLALSDAGALSFHKQELDFGSLTRQAVEAFESRMGSKGINLELQISDGIWFDGDPQRLRQLLHNLLENCCRYTEHGATVRLQLQLINDRIELYLEDSGPGLKTTQIEQLFDRFYRVEASRSRSTGGSGLGLAICRNIVEAHQGSIKAEHSTLGGLGIRIIFPVAEGFDRS